MIPSIFVPLAALPSMPNGKVDRNALKCMPLAPQHTHQTYVAPKNETESTLVKIWCEVLNLQQVGTQDNFFDLGGHSLLTTHLAVKVRRAFQRDISLRNFFLLPTISNMAQLLQASKAQPVDLWENIQQQIHQDIQLDPAIVTPSSAPLASTPPAHVLLTGATGFLGTFLLHELLAQTEATITCLVRASSPAEALQRILASLHHYIPQTEYAIQRIIPMPGDLTKPYLGLTTETFQHIAETIDSIYHNGAQVNFIAPYATLKAANVLGTQEVLRLASYGKSKPVHFISTNSVFSSVPSPSSHIYNEESDIGAYVPHSNGYTQSKWAAEKLVIAARARGLQTVIYRLGRVSGQSQTGACQADDFLWRMLSACVQLGSAPNLTIPLEMAPVDFVSQAVISLSLYANPVLKHYHLHNPHPVAFQDLLAAVRSMGYSMSVLPFAEWREHLLSLGEHSSENPAYPLLTLFSQPHPNDEIDKALAEPVLDQQQSKQALAQTQILCPQIDSRILRTYIAYFVRIHFIPAPSNPEANNVLSL